MPVASRLIDSEAHGSVGRRFEKQKLRGAGQQDWPQRTLSLQGSLQITVENGFQLAETPQHRRRDQARQRAIPRFERAALEFLGDSGIERVTLVQHSR
jgi:hypothetical protein